MPDRARRCRANAQLTRVSFSRRRAFRWLLLPAAHWVSPAAWADASRIASTRLWPAEEYTRVIFEATAPIEHQMVVLRNPDRLVLDLARVERSREIDELPSRVQPGDPYIAAIRVGNPSGGFLRIVLDLKGEVRPQVFALKPVAEFGHRLVIDLYPLAAVDPLMALLEREARGERRARADLGSLVGDLERPARGHGQAQHPDLPRQCQNHHRQTSEPEQRDREPPLGRRLLARQERGQCQRGRQRRGAGGRSPADRPLRAEAPARRTSAAAQDRAHLRRGRSRHQQRGGGRGKRAAHGDAHAKILYGTALQQLGQPLSAERQFEAAARLAPNDPDARVAAAVGRFDKASPAVAFGKLGPLTRVFPNAQTVRFHLGLLLLWSAQVKEARKQLEEARREDPDSPLGKQATQYLAALARIGTG